MPGTSDRSSACSAAPFDTRAILCVGVKPWGPSSKNRPNMSNELGQTCTKYSHNTIAISHKQVEGGQWVSLSSGV